MIDEYKLKRTLRKLVVLMNNLQFKSMDQFFKEEGFEYDEIFQKDEQPIGTVTKEEVEELVKANVNPKEMNKKVLAKEVKPTKPEVI